MIRNVVKSLQQRDCSGFSPDSLLIAFCGCSRRTNVNAKIAFFFGIEKLTGSFTGDNVFFEYA